MTLDTSLFTPSGSRKYLNQTEREAFLSAACAIDDPLRKALCLTVYFTGCRISEALSLRPDNVDVAERLLIFKTLKQHGRVRHRAIPIPLMLLELLAEVAQGKGREDPIWAMARSTAYLEVKQVMKQAGIAGAMACPRGLRHGFAVACVTNGIPLPTIQKWLGHALIRTTAVYLEVVGKEERELAARLWDLTKSDG